MSKWDERPQYIKQIETDKLYPTTHLSRVEYDNLTPAFQDITEAKKQGRLKFIISKQSHLLLGADVISLLNRRFDEIKSEEKLVNEFIKNLPEHELFDKLHTNVKLERKTRKLQKTNNHYQAEINRLQEENKQLRSLYSSREDIEEQRVHEIKKHVDKVIFGNKPVRVAHPQFINACGIYFLFSRGQVIYVGQSINIPSRIGQHKADGKVFDEVRFILCDTEELQTKERFFLKLLKPPLNGKNTTGGEHKDILRIVGIN